MWKRISLVVTATLVAVGANAQWTAKDSLNLQRLLSGDGEIKLNREAVKQIDLGKPMGTPMEFKSKSWLKADESLPAVLPEKKKLVLTLHPYTANTRFDWDPIYQKKIKVGKDTWRGDDLYAMKMQLIYTDWAKTPMEGKGGYRRSLDEIEATGIRHVVMGERANNMMVNEMRVLPTAGISLGKGVSMSGGTISGLNLMRIFEKDFWDKQGNERRARTLEVLKAYGDSTTVAIPHAVLTPVVR